MASALDDLVEESADIAYVDLCKICLRTRSKYVCPRCNTPYCSLDCYKSEVHIDCSESFYQEWVEKELKQYKVGPEGHKKMLEILNRVNSYGGGEELDSDDDDDRPDLADRIAGIDLNDADKVWENLSDQEKAAFQSLVNSNEVAGLIQPWEPWWTKTFNEPKVRPLESDTHNKELSAHKNSCPLIAKNIKPLTELTKSKPSPLVLYDLINILGGYTLVVRYYNGDHFDFQEEAATLIFTLAQSLSSAQKFTSADMALEAVGLKALISTGLDTGEKEINMMKKDVSMIMSGPAECDKPFYVLAVLSDLLKLFTFVKKKTTPGKFSKMFNLSDLNLTIIDKKTRDLCSKRINYFMSWSLNYDFSS